MIDEGRKVKEKGLCIKFHYDLFLINAIYGIKWQMTIHSINKKAIPAH